MQSFTAVCTGGALAAAATYQMYHAVWKSRDSVAMKSSLYNFAPEVAGVQMVPKRLHDEVIRNFSEHWNQGVLTVHSFLSRQLTVRRP